MPRHLCARVVLQQCLGMQAGEAHTQSKPLPASCLLSRAENSACWDFLAYFCTPCCTVAQDARDVHLQQKLATEACTDRDEFEAYLKANRAALSNRE